MPTKSTLDMSVKIGWRGWLAMANYREGIVDDVVEMLAATGAVKLSGMPGKDEFTGLADRLGKIFLPKLTAASESSRPGEPQLYEVRVKNQGSGELDLYGEPILSTVAADFSLHTDGYNQPVPPKYILLLRTDDSAELPATYLVDGFVLVGRLSEMERSLLQRPVYPNSQGQLPALWIDDGIPKFRWNDELIHRWARRAAACDTEILTRATEMLRTHLADIVMQDTLRRGDCLILDNERWFHGRSALKRDSTRVLQRAWVGGRG